VANHSYSLITIINIAIITHCDKNLAIANRSRVSFINTNRYIATIWLPQKSHVCMSLPLTVCACIWLRQESLRHILASPGYTPGLITVNVTWMKRGFNACQTHRSMYPSIFNRFPVIQPESSKVRHFSTFLSPLGTPLGQSR